MQMHTADLLAFIVAGLLGGCAAFSIDAHRYRLDERQQLDRAEPGTTQSTILMVLRDQGFAEKSSVVPNGKSASIPVCCEPGLYFQHSECISRPEIPGDLEFPLIYTPELAPSNKTHEDFHKTLSYPCDHDSYGLFPGDDYYFLEDGHILADNFHNHFTQADYCVAMIFDPESNETTSIVAVCLPPDGLPWFYLVCDMFSATFLTLAFIAYMILPDLQNVKGIIVRRYIFVLMVAYYMLVGMQIMGNQDFVTDTVCYVFAYIVHFSFLASFFWLNVMCFDIWWTFGGFRSLHGSVKQRERKKFIMYSIYAWGCAIILTTFCMVMDLVPNIPINFPRPQFGQGSCWFHTSWARAIYFYIPMGLTIICNIVLFLLTAHKISKHKKDTARQLKSSDSRRHDDNKQWFNLYLKLFIVMGINWSMEIVSWLLEGRKEFKYIWYITDLTNTLQGVIIFIIFVWKDKIKRLLMKRFGCQGGNFLTRHSASGRNGCATNSSASRATCVTSAPLHEKTNPYVTDPYKSKVPVTDDSDCM